MLKLNDNEFVAITSYLKDHYGINLTQKRALIEGRLGTYLLQRGFKNYLDYINAVKADKTGHELEQLLNRVTTNHTFFMREAEHFYFFRDKILPDLSKNVSDRNLRIWSAACSSGEEPYTLQMILHDYFASNISAWDTKLLATDISERALEKGRIGVYAAEALKDVPPTWKSKYFEKIDDYNYQIVKKVKDDVIYKEFNLMDDFPWKKPFHVIFCRNVMIYFDLPTKTKLIEKYYDYLVPGGYLFVGLTESIAKNTTRFKYIQPSVYQK